MITIPGFGDFSHDEYGTLIGSERIRVPALGIECHFVLEGYEDDSQQTDFHDAMVCFHSLGVGVLREASKHVFAYYSAVKESGWGDPPEIQAPDQVWDFVDFGEEAVVSRRSTTDTRIYISLECSCAWEREHGLQIVFREGKTINKVGPYDGHLTNSDAFANPSLENTVYVG